MEKRKELVQAIETDGDLLAEYLESGREEAFAQLLRRHGAMVMATCRSVLGNNMSSEDAAQAVFVTLARKAAALRRQTTVAGWLHRVAWYVAMRARQAAVIRRKYEQEAARMKEESPRHEAEIPNEQLHRVLSSLPEKYRVALLLHHVEGHTEEETAALMRCSYSAASSRLSRGRQMLKQRMAKGVTAATATAVVKALGRQAAVAPTGAFIESTAKIAVSLATGKAVGMSVSVTGLYEGAMHMMRLAKMKVLATATAALLLVGGLSFYVQRAIAAGAPSVPQAVAAGTATAPDAVAKDLKLALSFSPERNLLVSFQNTSPKPLVLDLGEMLGNGNALYPSLVEVLVVDAQQGIHKYVKRALVVGGRVDDWLVPLAPGDSYVLSIQPDTLREDANVFKPAAGVRLKIHFEGTGTQKKAVTIPRLPIWKGSVDSAEMEIPVLMQQP